jgi:hypothetical protein
MSLPLVLSKKHCNHMIFKQKFGEAEIFRNPGRIAEAAGRGRPAASSEGVDGGRHATSL